jgi:chemotaxis protein histidine kinase CheA
VGDTELLEMLAQETDRRVPGINNGLQRLAESSDPDPPGVEGLRVEVHGLKGAAMVIGQVRLADLAKRAEKALADRADQGTIDPDLAGRLTAAVEAFQAGTHAAANNHPEPASVAESLAALP